MSTCKWVLHLTSLTHSCKCVLHDLILYVSQDLGTLQYYCEHFFPQVSDRPPRWEESGSEEDA